MPDSGVEIGKNFHEAVFQPFIRHYQYGEIEGFEFGMSICRKITELHGGRIWLESAPSKGTDVYFVIPDAGPG